FGDFSGKVPFSEVAHRVKRLFNLDGYWVSHPVPEQVKRVGFVAGKGSSFVTAAASQGCDLLITGEAGYHAVLEGVRRGMTVMEIGHRESERLFLKSMEKWILHLGLRAVIVDEVAQTMRSWSDFK
ncbi:MAG: Nif3-like dinuclear metal center hexameric protein, partial [Bdellovibrionales bacterium]|nr:Nif3-like dinuclear metal center hexameric protein [Bdellovibrionales bacterium]